jgi:ABC-type glycerol-3-phosphate transport system substrate-binding protein
MRARTRFVIAAALSLAGCGGLAPSNAASARLTFTTHGPPTLVGATRA